MHIVAYERVLPYKSKMEAVSETILNSLLFPV